nr:hypothetical protein [Tanacetum cinerariifolium]
MKASRLSSDIISSLPPIIKETNLCLLPIQEAVRTSVLSKEWRYSWTKIPKLVFDDRKFRISTELNRSSVMEQTFHNLSERKTMSDKGKFFYAIYQVLLLHQGPILEFTLSMHGANYGCVEIDQMITHLSRKNTVTKLMLDLNNSYRLPLSIFSLQQLTDLTLTHFVRIHDGTGCFGIDDKGAALIELLKCLHGVAQLTCGLWNVGFEKSVFPRELPTLLVHLKYVCLVHWSFIDKFWLRLLALLMRSSPNLEKIEILTCEIDSIAQEDFSDIWLEHLHEFVIGYFGCMILDLELVKFILAKSPLLKKVRITLTDQVSKDEKLKICKILLRSPRASPQVDIIVVRETIVLMELQGDNEQTVTSQADLSPGPYVMTDMPLGIHILLFIFVFPTYSCLIPDFFMLASDELVIEKSC